MSFQVGDEVKFLDNNQTCGYTVGIIDGPKYTNDNGRISWSVKAEGYWWDVPEHTITLIKPRPSIEEVTSGLSRLKELVK